MKTKKVKLIEPKFVDVSKDRFFSEVVSNTFGRIFNQLDPQVSMKVRSQVWQQVNLKIAARIRDRTWALIKSELIKGFRI